MTGTTEKPEPQQGASEVRKEQQQQDTSRGVQNLQQKLHRDRHIERVQQARKQGMGDFGI